MACRDQSSDKNVRADKAKAVQDSCIPRNALGRVVVRSIKTGQFTRSEIKKAIRKVTSERLARCQSA